MKLTVLLLPRHTAQETKRIKTVLHKALRDIPHRVISDLSQMVTPTRLLVALSLGQDGYNPSFSKLLQQLRSDSSLLKGSMAGMVVEAESDLYGKNAASQLAFALNGAGCSLVSHPLVEATTLAQGDDCFFADDNSTYYDDSDPLAPLIQAVALLGERVTGPGFRGKSPLTGRPGLPRLVAVHASLEEEPNVNDLWEEMKHRLTPFMTCEEVGLRQQGMTQCNLCNYGQCTHFRRDGNCFYGSVLPEEGMRQILRADAFLLICGNYNNGLHPLFRSFLQQISTLFPKTMFQEKALYSLIVSPYSGGDMVVNEIISTLSLDNSFYLPPRFAFLETASEPMEALGAAGIEEKLDWYTHNILETVSLGHFC